MDIILQEDCDAILAAISVERFAGKTILLTGSCGFLGTYFMHAFVRANQTLLAGRECRLLALDNFSRGRPPWLEELEAQPGVEVLSHDVVQPLPESVGHLDFVIHAASIASPIYYRKRPIETMDANVTGLRLLLDRAVSDPPESFLFFSTSEIYGDPDPAAIPTPETYRGFVSCTGPRACYDESKRYGETLCVNFQQVHGVPVKIARPFNNYGPGLKLTDRRALPDFCRNVLAGEDIVLLSDGTPTRTFCYVADAITGYLQLLLSDLDGESVNIGSPGPEISVRDLAERVVALAREELDYAGQVVFAKSGDREYLTDNPDRRCPDVSKAKRLLGYEPRVDLEEGLRRNLRWYRDNPFGGDE